LQLLSLSLPDFFESFPELAFESTVADTLELSLDISAAEQA
jgi:hypothetical protein